MKKYIIGMLGILPLSVMASSPDCHSWPMNMAEAWMKNAGIVDIANLDESKTEIKQLASEKKGKDCTPRFITLSFMINLAVTTKLLPKATLPVRNVQSVK
jgi:hypothetical protein